MMMSHEPRVHLAPWVMHWPIFWSAMKLHAPFPALRPLWYKIRLAPNVCSAQSKRNDGKQGGRNARSCNSADNGHKASAFKVPHRMASARALGKWAAASFATDCKYASMATCPADRLHLGTGWDALQWPKEHGVLDLGSTGM